MWYDAFTQWQTYLDIFLLWIIIIFAVKFALSNKRAFITTLISLGLVGLSLLSKFLDLKMSGTVYGFIIEILPVFIIIVLAPDIRRYLESEWKPSNKKSHYVAGSQNTRDNIADAIIELSSTRTGALITIEKHNTLDQFSDKAVMMDSLVTKELLLNIFIDKSPLHDGAVIIRGDRIVAAAAYYTLSDSEAFDKTTGSRHRAGLGISEISDSMTIIISEETGNISLALSGIMVIIPDREKLMERLNAFMK